MSPAEAAPPSVFAVVKLSGLTPPREDLTESAVLKLHARYAASIQAIAAGAGASHVVTASDMSAFLSFEGSEGPALAHRAFLAARLLRERLLVDLDLTTRLAVHAAARPERAEAEQFRKEVQQTCERLQQAAPVDTLAVSPEVYLVLPEADRRHMSPLVELEGDGLTAALFPAPPALASAHLRESARGKLWGKFRAYLGSSEVRRLRYVGFRLQKKEPPSLDIFDVFVVPTVAVRKLPPPPPEELAAPPWSAGVAPVPKSLPFPGAFRKYRSLVILGDPGSGKTTLLKWLAVLGSRGPLATHAALGTSLQQLPLLVSVGRLAELRTTLGGAASVLEVMARYFRERNVEQDETGLKEFLAQELSEGRCLVLMDGLDEVQSEAREGVMRWLEAFALQYPANRFIASARQVGYVGLELPESAEVTLGPFEDEQVRRYVQSFQRAYKHWEEGSPDDVTADRTAERLLEALFANQRLHELSRNPFILSSLALIHRAEGQLPRHRVQAYEIFARTLCETWGQARRIAAGGPEEEQLRYEEEAVPILGRLALELHRAWPTGVAPESFIVDVLAQAIQEREGTHQETALRSAREFLKKAGSNVQILLERGTGRWGFLHLTFQEFFAAMGLHAAELFFEEGKAHLFDSRWEEILRLGVGYMALVQKRPEGVRRFIQSTLSHEEHGQRSFITQVLRKQIPLAALFATEAGDTLPAILQDKLASLFSEWLCTMPQSLSEASFGDVLLSDFAGRLTQPLIQLAHSKQPEIREQAIHHLGRLKAPAASTVILAALSDEDAKVRAAAAAAVEAMRLVAASDSLEELLLDPEVEVKASAASALMALHPERMEEIVRAWNRQDDLEIQLMLFGFLPKLYKTPAGAALTDQLLKEWESSETPVHQFVSGLVGAVRGTNGVTEQDLEELPLENQDDLSPKEYLKLFQGFISSPKAAMRRMLLASVKRGLPPSEELSTEDAAATDESALALKLLQAPDSYIQVVGAVALTLKGHPAGTQSLIKLTQASDSKVRRTAVMNLRDSREPEVLPALVAASRDDDASVRRWIALSLARWTSSGSITCLLNFLDDPDQEVRTNAASSLGSIKAEAAIAPLVRMASSSVKAEHDAALKALWAIASV